MSKGGGREGGDVGWCRDEEGREEWKKGGETEDGREEECRSKGAGSEAGGRREDEGGEREGGEETGVRIKVGVMELEWRKLGVLEEGGRE